MKKAASIIFSLLLAFAAAAEAVYISPNDDGVKDVLSFPLKITDKRYVASWALVIMDKNRQIVRTIGNKEALPSKISLKNIMKHIKDAKKNADVPPIAQWNGRLDNGQTAPDGEYTYYITAVDDNGNTSKTQEYTVIVDNTPPKVVIEEIKDKVFGAGEKAEFNIVQSGSKEDEWTACIASLDGTAVRHYTWQGMPENISWNGTDDNGLPVSDGVYSYSIEAIDRAGNKSERAAIENIVFSADKSVTAVSLKGDRYFSPGTASQKQTVSFDITIPVPNKKSANRLVQWEVAVLDEANKTKRKWGGRADAMLKKPMQSLVYDGLDEGGKVLPDGKYKVMVTAKYLNGYESPAAYSPQFVLDTSTPLASAAVSNKIFGEGDNSTITITAQVKEKPLAKVKKWMGRVERADTHKVVREWDAGQGNESIVWDGSGEGAEDGEYIFRLYGTDQAGNYGEAVSDVFVLDTSKALVSLKAEQEAFNPKSKKGAINFSVKTHAGVGGIANYTFSIARADASKAAAQEGRADGTGSFDEDCVYKVTGEGAPPKHFAWDGKGNIARASDAADALCADGEYIAQLQAEGANTSKDTAKSMPFVLDTISPFAKASMETRVFAPGCEGARQKAEVAISDCTKERLWKAEVTGKSGEADASKVAAQESKAVRHFEWRGKVPSFEWDGTDDSGNIANDGDYTITLSSADDAENSFSVSLPAVTLDTRDIKGYITTKSEGISPNGDGFLDTQVFSIALSVNDSIVFWQADVCDEKGQAVHSWMGGEKGKLKNVPPAIEWDGFVAGGAKNRIAGEGTFNCVLKVQYKTGRCLTLSSRPFVCTATPPILSVGMTPEYFSPDNDGVDDDLFLKLGCVTKAGVKEWQFKVMDPRGKVFWQTGGSRAVSERITWDGLSNTQRDSYGMAERVQSAVDYPYTFTVLDDLGMSSTIKGIIPVDVLVIRDGNVLKMAVPSIIFRSDHADFKVESKPGKKDGVTAEQARNNEKVLSRVAQVLGKFKDYKVTVVGHANRTNENDAEETVSNPMLWGPALIPLSEQRAEAVKAYLTKHGVSKSRLGTEGKGGTQPVADWHDKDNNWKNRRVEFILHK